MRAPRSTCRACTGIFAPVEEHAFHLFEVVLKPVIDLGEHTGPQFHFQHPFGEFHRIAGFETAGAFKHLGVGNTALDLYDFGLQLHAIQVYIADLVLGDGAIHLYLNQIGDNSFDDTFGHYRYLLFVFLFDREFGRE